MRTAALLAAASGLAVTLVSPLAGCGAEDGTAVDPPVDELAAHAGSPCPATLPEPRDDAEVAPSSPTLPAPERAWVCGYEPPGSSGTSSGWARSAPPTEVAAVDLAGVADLLGSLSPADPDRMCTADLGPRWLLVLAVGGDLTGVLVDDFGCRDVRLTDEPFTTPAGAATAPGVVPGVLRGPEGLLEAVRAAGAPRVR